MPLRRRWPKLPLLAALALAGPPGVARSQPVWTESGDVRILVRTAQGSVFDRPAESLLASDTILSIEIGDPGPLGERESGSLFVSGEGEAGAPRDLDDVEVRVGDLELVESFVDGIIDVGPGLPDQGTGTLAVNTFSEVDARVSVIYGTLLCQTSRMANVSLGTAAQALVSGCVLDALTAAPDSNSQFVGGRIDAAFPRLGGSMTLQGTEIDAGISTRVWDGTVSMAGSTWDTDGLVDVWGSSVATDVDVSASTVWAQTTDVRGGTGREASLRIEAGTVWTSFGRVRIFGGGTTVEVASGSRLDAREDLEILGIGTGLTVGSTGVPSRVEVAGDLAVGQLDETTFGEGTLTIEDGGVVDVDGTLVIRPLATVNLDGGTLRVSNLVQLGTLNENGGTLIVPEAGAGASALAALAALAASARARAGAGHRRRGPPDPR